MQLDTAIQENHHFKVFCYIILVYHGRHCEFVGNFLSRMRFNNISLLSRCFNTPCKISMFDLQKECFSFKFEKGLTVLKGGGGLYYSRHMCLPQKRLGGNKTKQKPL